MPSSRIKTRRLFDGDQLRTAPSLAIVIRGDRIDSILVAGTDLFGELRDRQNHEFISGNPIEDPRLLAEPEKYLQLVIRGGEIIVNRLPENLA